MLAQLNIETGQHAEKIVEVWNKIDLLDKAQREALSARLSTAEHNPVMVSTHTGEGIAELKARIDALLSANHVERTFRIPVAQGALIAWLYEHAQVYHRRDQDDGYVELDVKIAKAALGRFEHMLSAQN